MRLEPVPQRREPATLVTGSGRCGTGWLAKVLNHAGVNAGHEEWWTLEQRRHGLDVDVSWLGCFDDGYPGRVIALVRSPWTCIPSIYAAESTHPWHLVRAQNVPLSGDWPVDACKIWAAYTAHAVKRAELVWRIEDVTAEDIAEAFDLDLEPVEVAFGEIPPTVNARPGADFHWPADTTAVHDLAADLGYMKGDLDG